MLSCLNKAAALAVELCHHGWMRWPVAGLQAGVRVAAGAVNGRPSKQTLPSSKGPFACLLFAYHI